MKASRGLTLSERKKMMMVHNNRRHHLAVPPNGLFSKSCVDVILKSFFDAPSTLYSLSFFAGRELFKEKVELDVKVHTEIYQSLTTWCTEKQVSSWAIIPISHCTFLFFSSLSQFHGNKVR